MQYLSYDNAHKWVKTKTGGQFLTKGHPPRPICKNCGKDVTAEPNFSHYFIKRDRTIRA